jgi:hypothetical protein
MQEAEARLIQDTFSSVMPYLVYPQDFRSLLEKLLGEKADIKTFSEQLRQAISTEADPTRKTDGQIFINELRRKFSM